MTAARPPHRAVVPAIILAGLALNACTLHAIFQVDRVHEKPALTLITEAAELTRRRHDVVGAFATGEKAGDRVLVVKADGAIHFSEIGPHAAPAGDADAYRLARRGPKICLATERSGVVDVLNFDTLLYYGDTYRRK